VDLEQWKDAINDFKQSLEVNPNSFLTEFSINECIPKWGSSKKL